MPGFVAFAKAKCLVLDRESFNLLLGPLKDIIEAAREGRQRPERAAPEAQGCDLVSKASPLWICFPFFSMFLDVDPGVIRAFTKSTKWVSSSLGLAENRTKIKRSDLKRIGLLGCGGFGAVELWEHSTTGWQLM